MAEERQSSRTNFEGDEAASDDVEEHMRRENAINMGNIRGVLSNTQITHEVEAEDEVLWKKRQKMLLRWMEMGVVLI